MKKIIVNIFSTMQNIFRYHKKSLITITLFMSLFLTFSLSIINLIKVQNTVAFIISTICFINILLYAGYFFFSNK